MKKLSKIIFLILVFLFLLFSSITDTITMSENRKIIVTTIYPYYLLVKQIVNDKFEIQLFIPPNASPHTYSPNPSDIVKLNKASLIIANGLSLEENLKSKLTSFKNKVIYCSDFIENDTLFKISNKSNINYNPHIWLDPYFMIKIAKGITEKIIEMDKTNKSYYENNLKELIKSLNNTISKIKNEKKIFAKEIYLITLHDSFRYFAKRFNIKIVGVIEPSPGKEPGIKDLIKIGKLIKQYSIKAIFSEPQLNPKPVKVLAKEYNLKVFSLDPLGYFLNIDKIEELYNKNWKIIKNALEK